MDNNALELSILSAKRTPGKYVQRTGQLDGDAQAGVRRAAPTCLQTGGVLIVWSLDSRPKRVRDSARKQATRPERLKSNMDRSGACRAIKPF